DRRSQGLARHRFPQRMLAVVLADEGRVARFGDDLWIGIAAYRTAEDAVRRLAATEEGITVGSLRDATGSSRKIILPLLEHFDGIRLTRRIVDNHRVLAEPGPADRETK
ncbi:MAG: SelB C-terminal domain-containing protein, partial [Armatimonadota bacterium]